MACGRRGERWRAGWREWLELRALLHAADDGRLRAFFAAAAGREESGVDLRLVRWLDSPNRLGLFEFWVDEPEHQRWLHFAAPPRRALALLRGVTRPS